MSWGRRLRRIGLCLLSGLCAASNLSAQEPEDLLPFLAQSNGTGSVPSRPSQAPGQVLPLQATRRVAFDTDEGTWMSVDLSPDGRQLVFDLLGDLYTMAV